MVSIRFRVRQALKDFLRHAVEHEAALDGFGLSQSEIIRRSLDDVLSVSLSPRDARGLVLNERDALDYGKSADDKSPVGPSRVSSYRYRDTPWVALNVQLEPDMPEALRHDAERLGLKRDELLRGAVFSTLRGHYNFPPNQRPSEAELGYVHDSETPHAEAVGGSFGLFRLDPRHPDNRGQEREAAHRLQELARRPNADPRHVEIQGKFDDFIDKLTNDYHRFIAGEYKSIEEYLDIQWGVRPENQNDDN